MRFQLSFGVAALAWVSSVEAVLSSTGFTVSLNDVDYYLPPKPAGVISGTGSLKVLLKSEMFVPITVVKGTASIASITATYASSDDVWQTGFLDAVYYQGSKPANSSITILSGHASPPLAPGPYFLNAAGQVYEAWRLYSDVQGAFTESVFAKGDGSYMVLPAGTVGQKSAVAVPSRLYYEKTASKPLAGVRIGIKDIYDIKGLRTSNGNRAWYWLYAPANNTATPVQRLIDAGAIIVGKMITSQFANGETATADWVDYHESFNPRGDGYQDTSSSSAGGGAGMASYAWLDVALGSDTGGSVRGPAQRQGLYGNRPTTGIVTLEHTMPLSPTLDTAGLLARDPVVWQAAAQAMYGTNLTISTAYPKTIRTLGFPTAPSTPANALLLSFLANVTAYLSANTTAFNLTASYSTDNPTLAPLTTLLNITYLPPITKEQTALVRAPFYAAYAAKHNGRLPFVNPVPLVRWAWSDENPQITVDQAVANLTTFRTWLDRTVLAPSPQTCSSSLLMYPGSTAATAYRNIYKSAPTIPMGISSGSISNLGAVPDYTVPIGEAAYNSTITGVTEYLPVTVDFVAARGCDGMLFGLVSELYSKGILKRSEAGSSAVGGGEILFRRGEGA